MNPTFTHPMIVEMVRWMADSQYSADEIADAVEKPHKYWDDYTEATREDNEYWDDIRYPHVHVQLTGTDGNAGAIMDKVVRALRKGGVSHEEVAEYRRESMSGDYSNLIHTAMKWVDVS